MTGKIYERLKAESKRVWAPTAPPRLMMMFPPRRVIIAIPREFILPEYLDLTADAVARIVRRYPEPNFYTAPEPLGPMMETVTITERDLRPIKDSLR